MRLSNPLTIMAFAMMKPPMKRNVMGLAKAAKASFIFTTPNITHNVGPTSEVTGMGMGSVIHHRHTSVMMERSLWASGVRPSIGVINTSSAQMGAHIAPMRRRLRSNFELPSISSSLTVGAFVVFCSLMML